MLDDKRFAEMKASIQDRGLLNAIILADGKILDGRNRYKACQETGVQPRFDTLPTGTDPWLYVWDQNANRRDLVAEQRYLIWKHVEEQSDAWLKTKQKIEDVANQKRAKAINQRPRGDDGKTKAKPVVEQCVPPLAKKHVASQAKAAASKTNVGAVKRGDQLANHRPDLAAKVRTGEMKPADAHRQMKRDQVKQKLDDVAAREVEQPTGEFDVIVIDPPWPMKKIERDERPNQVEFDYPTMSEAELGQLPIPAAKDCHVWLWTTHKFLPMAFRLLGAWNLKYVCTFVWHKPGGFQPIGLPQYNCEFALYAKRGSPKFLDTKQFPTCFDAPRGQHSEKPDAFYDVVRRVTGGRRLDMFNRRAIEGFQGWGKEAAK